MGCDTIEIQKEGSIMKKILMGFLAMFLFVGVVKAETSETLKEACQAEGLTCNHTDKAYDESLPSVYIFRGDGCPHCIALLQFMSTIADKYKINIVIYEVSKNKDNWNFYKKVGAKFKQNVSGYPFTVIGDKTIDGFETAETTGIEVEEAIKTLVETEEPYDVVADVLDDPVETISRGPVLAFIFGIIAVVGAVLGYRIMTKN